MKVCAVCGREVVNSTRHFAGDLLELREPFHAVVLAETPHQMVLTLLFPTEDGWEWGFAVED